MVEKEQWWLHVLTLNLQQQTYNTLEECSVLIWLNSVLVISSCQFLGPILSGGGYID